jgi:hypothetical protein
MRKGEGREITLDKRKHWAEYLGKGRYSTAFLLGRDVIIYTRRGDNGKEILTHCRPSPHIPVCERIEVQDGPRGADWDIYVYKMPLYQPIRPGSEAWACMKELARAREEAYTEFITEQHMVRYNGAVVNYAVQTRAKVSDSVREALEELTNRAADWGSSYMFDAFRRPNLNQDDEGRIILRDVLYDAEPIYDEWCRKMRTRQSMLSIR